MSGEKYVTGWTNDVAGVFKNAPDIRFPGIFDVSVERGRCVAIFLNKGDISMAEKCAAALNAAEKTVTSPNTQSMAALLEEAYHLGVNAGGEPASIIRSQFDALKKRLNA